MNTARFTLCFLLAASFWVSGCATQKPVPDPLAGWKTCHSQEVSRFNKAITDDYQDYIQKLPPGEKFYVNESNIWFLEDGTGQFAVKISIPLNGTWREHVLIYDKENKRIKVMVYSSGRYSS